MSFEPRKALRAGLDGLVRSVSRNYIAGPRLEDAAGVSRTLSARGYWATLGYWDGAGDRPQDVLDINLAACEALAALGGENYLSVKAPALGGDAGMLRILMERSEALGAPLHFDSLDIDRAAAIFECAERCASSSSREVGCTLPGRWRRSLDDAERAIALGFAVRVVKGQSPDPADPRRDPAAGYLEIVETLAGRARRVRVASHNPRLARRSLAILKAANTPCELELLYGLPVGGQAALAMEFGVPVRVYAAFGHAYLPYAINSARRNPGVILRLAREALRGDCLSTFPDLGEQAAMLGRG